jgi:hypothetical protein
MAEADDPRHTVVSVRLIKSFDYGTIKCIPIKGEHGLDLTATTVGALKDMIRSSLFDLFDDIPLFCLCLLCLLCLFVAWSVPSSSMRWQQAVTCEEACSLHHAAMMLVAPEPS